MSFYPADGRGIKNYVCAHERGYPRGLRHPLVVADKHSYCGELGFINLIAHIAVFKIIFFIKERVKGDVYLAICAQNTSVRVYGHGGVVIAAVLSFFKQRDDNYDAEFLCQLRKKIYRISGYRLRKPCRIKPFVLGEIYCAEKFLKADNLCALCCSLPHKRNG